jgi:hypothetical protein
MILGDLEQGVTPDPGQGNLFAETQPTQLAVDFTDRHGFVNIEKLKSEFERINTVGDVAEGILPIHWHLEFADIYSAHKGFDLTIGNPPWVRTTWQESYVLSDYEPLFRVRGLSASQAAKSRERALGSPCARAGYLSAYEESAGFQSLFSRRFPLFSGEPANLYKAFIDLSLGTTSKHGVVGLIHPDGVYIDPGCQKFRRTSYSRKAFWFQFRNEKRLFDILNTRTYCVSIWKQPGPGGEDPSFAMIAKLFHPSTIDASLDSSSSSDLPIKTSEGSWNTAGSLSRIINVDSSVLSVFSSVLGDEDHSSSRIIPITSQSLVTALKSFSQSRNLGSTECFVFAGLDETSLEKASHLVKKPAFPSDGFAIIPSPQFSPNNPLSKTARTSYSNPKHFDSIDLETVGPDYAPRTVYAPTVDYTDFSSCYDSHLPWSKDKGIGYFDSYKLFVGRRLDPETERTLQAAIFWPGSAHTNAIQGIAFRSNQDLAWSCALLGSIPYDFLIKASGKKDIYSTAIRDLPWASPQSSLQLVRAIENTLALNCLSSLYADFWNQTRSSANCFLSTRGVPDWRLKSSSITVDRRQSWDRESSPARTHLERYYLAVENDVIVSRALGISVSELISMYRLQFPVMQIYEKDTWYDSLGKIVFSPSKGLSGVGFPRKGKGRGSSRILGWEDIAEMTSGTVSRTIIDDTLPGGPVERTITYEAPFDRCDRVEDYRVAWDYFERAGT